MANFVGMKTIQIILAIILFFGCKKTDDGIEITKRNYEVLMYVHAEKPQALIYTYPSAEAKAESNSDSVIRINGNGFTHDGCLDYKATNPSFPNVCATDKFVRVKIPKTAACNLTDSDWICITLKHEGAVVYQSDTIRKASLTQDIIIE